MNTQKAPRSIHRHISTQQAGQETLVYDEQRHKAFCLNEVSSAIWRLADGEHTTAQIGVEASLELGAAISEEVVAFAIEELRREGLMEPSSCVEGGETVSRRAMLQGLAAGGAMLLPGIAAIVAPTAAQAYSGCFDCDSDQSVQAAQPVRSGQLARARRQQLNGMGPLNPVSGSSSVPGFFPDTEPGIGQPIVIDPDLQH